MVHKIFSLYIRNLLLITILVSCSRHIYKSGVSEPVFYPAPPDTTRIQFLTSYGSSHDVTGGRSKFASFVLGQEEILPIVKPYGIDIHNGNIFVADAGIAGLELINLVDNTFKYFTPGGRGKLILPINCFLDDRGYLYVSDVGRKQVVIYNESHEFKSVISGSENFKPTDVSVTNDVILVTDPNNNRINIYDKFSLQKLYSIPDEAEIGDDNWLYNPLNLYVRADKIYITDFGDSRVKIFTIEGEYLSSVGNYGRGPGQFVRPKGIAVDREQILYVVDAGFQNIQMFNDENELLMFFGGPYYGPGDMYLPAKVTLDYNHLSYFEKFVDPSFNLKYLIFVTNQYGPDKVNIYGRIVPKL